jgi:hypothetical protein
MAFLAELYALQLSSKQLQEMAYKKRSQEDEVNDRMEKTILQIDTGSLSFNSQNLGPIPNGDGVFGDQSAQSLGSFGNLGM